MRIVLDDQQDGVARLEIEPSSGSCSITRSWVAATCSAGAVK